MKSYPHANLFRLLCPLILMVFFVMQPVQAANIAQTQVTVKVDCGNGIMDGGEACDLTDFGGSTCGSFYDKNGQPYQSGTLTCSNSVVPKDCSAILTDKCSTCGNGVREGRGIIGPEECDGNDFGIDDKNATTSCLSFGYASGTLACHFNCTTDLKSCVAPLTEIGNENNQGGGTGGGGSSGGGSGTAGSGGSSGGGGAGGGGAGLSGTGNNTNINGSDIPPASTTVVITGKAYPNIAVQILVDGNSFALTQADAQANFSYQTDKITPGVINLGLRAKDSKGRESILQNVTFRVSSGAVTTVSGIYLPPSIEIDKTSVGYGENLLVSGQTAPNSTVIISFHSNSELLRYASSSRLGEWQYTLNTTPLDNEAFHNVKAMFSLQLADGLAKSGYSKLLNFYVGKSGALAGTCAGADLNRDGKVNLVDFSILLFNWGTANVCADQNKNGKVDLTDFSILLYNWTG